MIDCLIIGFNNSDFGDYVQMVKSMGQDSGAYRDLNKPSFKARTCGRQK